jgi:hypothetical protein
VSRLRSFCSLVLLSAVTACGRKAADPAPADAMPAATSSAGDALTGTVLEQLPASPYIYLRLKTAKGEIWAAVPETSVETGSTATVVAPMRMTAFESKSLNRTFDEIYFGTLASEAAAMAAPGGNPHAGAMTAAAGVEVGKVEKATGADARTVAELWAQKTNLEGNTVTLRGVVVKANNGVMGRNWIHLQDGSGTAADGTNDITVTSTDQAAKGETILIRGTVRTGKDFGAGYTYPIMVENARIVR